MGIFNRSTVQRIRMPTPKAHPITIRCKSCGTQASALLRPDREELPPGWVGAWVWFRRVYRCPQCGAERVKQIKALLDLK